MKWARPSGLTCVVTTHSAVQTSRNTDSTVLDSVYWQHAGRSGLAVACLTAVREVLGSNRAAGSCVYRTTTVIYSLGHVLCAPFLQCLGQLSLLPYMGR